MKGTKDVIRGCIVAKVIIVTFLRGKGTTENPSRLVHQYYDLKGNLLAENDIQVIDKAEGFGHSSEYTEWKKTGEWRPDERS